MARNFIISLLVIFFLITFTNSFPLEERGNSTKRQVNPNGLYVLDALFETDWDPNEEVDQYVTGRFTFTRIGDLTDNPSEYTVRVFGQCNTGLTDPDTSLYSFIITPRPVCPIYNERFDMTPFFTYTINVPGMSAVQYDFVNRFTLEEIRHMYVVVLMGGYPIGAAYIEGIGG